MPHWPCQCPLRCSSLKLCRYRRCPLQRGRPSPMKDTASSTRPQATSHLYPSWVSLSPTTGSPIKGRAKSPTRSGMPSSALRGRPIFTEASTFEEVRAPMSANLRHARPELSRLRGSRTAFVPERRLTTAAYRVVTIDWSQGCGVCDRRASLPGRPIHRQHQLGHCMACHPSRCAPYLGQIRRGSIKIGRSWPQLAEIGNAAPLATSQ